MKNKINLLLSFAFSMALLSFGQVVIADESLDAIKEELRAEYKQDLASYKAIEDKSTDQAKDMRAKLVNMGIEAKYIRDTMKEIKAEGHSDELREKLDAHINAFRQDRSDFTELYAALTKPAQEEEQQSDVDPSPVMEVAEDMGDELTLEEEPGDAERDVAEETVDTEEMEKIVVSENMTDTEEEGFEDDFDSDFE